jgi:hypothetical protein
MLRRSTAISPFEIWFKVQAAIGAGGDNTSYLLYYGNSSPGVPLADTNNVYGTGQTLIVHYDNDTSDGVDGEAPSINPPTGISYTTGVRVQGAVVIDNDTDDLRYSFADMFGASAPDTGTFEVWVEPDGTIWSWDNTAVNRLVFDGTGTHKFKLEWKNNGQLKAEIGNSAGARRRITATPGWTGTTPHHIAISWDFPNGNMYLFMDGVAGGTDDNGWGAGSSAGTYGSDLQVGNQLGGGKVLIGNFDELKGWNYAKTATELSYYNPEPGVSAGTEQTNCTNPSMATKQAPPANGAQNVNTAGVDLSWTGDASTYDIYLEAGVNPPTTIKCADTAGAPCNTGALLGNTTYYWKVVSKNGACTTDDTQVWSFTTCATPSMAIKQAPPNNGDTGVSTTVVLNWTGDATTYDVYVDTSNPPTAIECADTSGTSCNTSLNPNTTYYWKVVSKNSSCVTDDTNVWSFTTVNVTIDGNYTVCPSGCDFADLQQAIDFAVNDNQASTMPVRLR